MSLRVTTRQPAQELAVVDEKVAPRKLVRVEDERRQAKGDESDPEPQQPVAPDCQSTEQQHHEHTSSKVDGRTSKSRVEDTEGHASSCETTTCTDVAGTTKRKILTKGIRVDLANEHLEKRRERRELLGKTGSRAPEATLSKFLNDQRHEGDEENDEDGDNAALDPVEDRYQVHASSRLQSVGDGNVLVVLAEDDFVTQGTEVDQAEHEELYGHHDESVVDVETRVSIVEGQEAVQRKLSAEVVVLTGKHLLTHTSTNLGGEVENRTEAKITTLTALVVLAVLYATTTEQSVHTSVDILVQVQTLLSLGNTTTSSHEDTVEEIRVTIMELATNLCQSTSEEGTECLFLSGSHVTKDTNVLGEDVLASTENGDWVELGSRKAGSVWGDVVGGHLFELSKDAANLETLLEVVVLVGIDELDVFTTVEDQAVVLVVRLAVTKNRVARKHNSELWPANTVLHDFRVTVDKSRVDAWVLALIERWLFVEVSDLKIGVSTEKELGVFALFLGELGVTLHGDDDLELATGHALELALKLVRVTAEHLDDLGVLNTVEKLDGTAVVHETRDSTVKGLRSQGSPDTSSEGVLGSGRLETDAVERQIVNLALLGVLVILLVVAVELRGLISQNLGILDEAVPFVRVKLLEVFQHGNTRVRLVLTNDLTKREKDLLAVMRDHDSEGRHVIDWYRLGDWRRERLSEERDTTLGLTLEWEKLGLERVIFLGDEEGRGTKSALTLLLRWHLVVEKLLDVVDGEQVLTVHGDDDGVPDLGDENLGLVLDLHVGGCQNLGVDTLGQTREDVPPGSPDGYTEVERSCNREDRVQDNVPQEGIQEEQEQVGDVHDDEEYLWLLQAEDVANDGVTNAGVDGCRGQNSDRVTDGQNQVEVGLCQFGTEDHNPQAVGHPHIVSVKPGVASRESLTGHVLAGLASEVASEETTERHDREEDEGRQGNEELDNTEDQGDLAGLADKEDVDARSQIDDEDDEKEEQTLGQVLSTSPPPGDVHPFAESSNNVNQSDDSTGESGSRPLRSSRRLVVLLLAVVAHVQSWGVLGRIEPESTNVDDPDTVEVDDGVKPGTVLLVGLEESLLPDDILETLVPLSRWQINKS